MLKQAQALPTLTNPWCRFISDQEYKLLDLVQAAGLVADVLEDVISDDPKAVTGASDLYRIPEERANRMLYVVYEVVKKAKELRDNRSTFVDTVAAQKEATAEELRTYWADAVAQMAQALDFRRQESIYKLVDMLEDIAIGALPRQDHPNAATRPVITEICEALQHIRNAIGSAAEKSDPPADEYDQQDRASLLLRYWAGDPGTNANDIAEVIAPFLDEPATVTAKAA